MKILRDLVYFCTAATLCLACTVAMAAGTAPSEIKVGTLYASSGAFASVSIPLYQSLKLWAKEVNANGGAYVK